VTKANGRRARDRQAGPRRIPEPGPERPAEYRALTAGEAAEWNVLDAKLALIGEKERRLAAEGRALALEQDALRGEKLAVTMLAGSLKKSLGCDSVGDFRREGGKILVRVKDARAKKAAGPRALPEVTVTHGEAEAQADGKALAAPLPAKK
jgi:hypothetical protein